MSPSSTTARPCNGHGRRGRRRRCPRARRRERCRRPDRAHAQSFHLLRRHRRSHRPRRAVRRLDLVTDLDARALAHLDSPLARGVQEKGIEPATLRHPDHRRTRPALDEIARTGTATRPRRPFFDDRRRIDRAAQKGARRQPAAARLVAGEAGLVRKQDRMARRREVMRGRRARGAAADHENVKALHGSEATMRPAPGGVPERPKGTGCKPVGSAYGGSNPPAPIRTVPNTVASVDSRSRQAGRKDGGQRRAIAHHTPTTCGEVR